MITAQEAADLGQKVEQGKATAPARPHPGPPAQPGLLTGVGPLPAAAYRLHDLISGRGQD